MSLLLIVLGLLLWLLLGWTVVGIICVIVGVVLLFAEGSYYRGRW
jgi:hypothetical protein